MITDHPLVAVRSVEVTGLYRLKITFTDDQVRMVDLQPLLRGELFGPLRAEEIFRKVQIDPEAKTLVWPNGADLDPATLYEWDSVKDEISKRAASWPES